MKDKSKADINKYTFDLVNFIESERKSKEMPCIKCIKKETDYSSP